MQDPNEQVALLFARLGAFTNAAIERGAPPQELQAAREYLRYKLDSTFATGVEILELLAEGATALRLCDEATLEEEPVPGQTGTRIGALSFFIDEEGDKRRMVMVRRLNAWLYECASIRDAFAQLVNVAFRLGLDPEDSRIKEVVLGKLRDRVRDGKATGFEEWTNIPQHPPWLAKVVELRDIAMHRALIPLRERLTFMREGEPERSVHPILVHKGQPQELRDVVFEVQDGLLALMPQSLERVTDLLQAQP